MGAARLNASVTLLPSGKVLVAGGQVFNSSAGLSSAELYDPATNTWTSGGNLATGRYLHTATLLPSGKVLVVGGGGTPGWLSSAELYDPATNTWSAAATLPYAVVLATATLLPSGKVLLTGGYNGGSVFNNAELYDPATNTWSTAAHMAVARRGHTATLLSSGKVYVSGGHNGTNVQRSAELYDPATDTWAAAAKPITGRESHSATLLATGLVLTAGGDDGASNLGSAELYDPGTNTSTAAGTYVGDGPHHAAILLPSGAVLIAGGTVGALYDPTAGTWSSAGNLSTQRSYPSATLLASGRVLLLGGENFSTSTYLASTEFYDPTAAGTWSAAGTMGDEREGATTTLLPSGKVLAVGGFDGTTYVPSAELYDATTNTWSATGALALGRYAHTATLLPSGKVLVAGGSKTSAVLGNTEIYDPATQTFSAGATLVDHRSSHTATLLASGKVLLAGGNTTGVYLDSSEVYDPATQSSTAAGALVAGRSLHTATLLPSGKVLVAGGNNALVGVLSSAELFDPVSNTWSATGALAHARYNHSATLLPSGKVLIAGGYDGSGYLNSAELYDPATNTWSAAGNLANARYAHSATLLPSGRLLVAGGYNGSSYLSGAELYDPLTNAWTSAGNLASARANQNATLLPSGVVLIAGGQAGGPLNSAELFDAGLVPVPVRQPNLSAVNAFLLQTGALAATAGGSATTANALTATGFRPNLEASNGGTGNSASNAAVLQVQRLDNDQMLFVPNDGSTRLSDTAFTGSAGAFAGFPAGPVRIRAWVDGVPSAAMYSTLAVRPGTPNAPSAAGGLQATVNFSAVAETGGATITGYTATASPGGATNSCTAPCSSIVFDPIAPGSYTFTVHANNAAGAGGESPASNSVTVLQATTVAITSSADSVVGESYAVNVSVSAASGTPDGSVTVTDDAAPANSCGPVVLSGGTAACNITWNASGTYHLTATYAPASGSFFAGSNGAAPHTVGPAGQSAAFVSSAPAGLVYGNAPPYSVTASATSGLPVTLSIDAASTAGTCALSGNTVTFGNAGTCIVDADQPGDADYQRAPQQQQAIAIGRASQSITDLAASPAQPTYQPGGSFTLSATPGASGNALVFSAGPTSVCALGATSAASATIDILAAGACAVSADQAGNGNYEAAPTTNLNVTIGKAAQTIAFAAQGAQNYAPNGTFALNPLASASSGLAPSYTSLTETVCTIDTITVSIVSAGTCTIAADQAGDDDYAAAVRVTQDIAIGKAATQTTLATDCLSTFVENQPFTLQASVAGGAAGGSVTFHRGVDALCSNVALAAGSASCSVNDLAVSGSDTQTTYALTADYSGDVDYASSSTGTFGITVLSAADVMFRDGFEPVAVGCPVE